MNRVEQMQAELAAKVDDVERRHEEKLADAAKVRDEAKARAQERAASMRDAMNKVIDDMLADAEGEANQRHDEAVNLADARRESEIRLVQDEFGDLPQAEPEMQQNPGFEGERQKLTA